jgi:hypothetical protein
MKVHETKTQIIKTPGGFSADVWKTCIHKDNNGNWIVYSVEVKNKNGFISDHVIFDTFQEIKEFLLENYDLRIFQKDFKETDFLVCENGGKSRK